MSLKKPRLDWVGGTAIALSLFACYGTIAILGILGTLGIVIVLDEALWSGAIIAFAVLALGGFGLGFIRHRQLWPTLVGGFGVGILSYAMYIQYNRLTEIVGFIFLCLAGFWDWWIRRRVAKS